MLLNFEDTLGSTMTEVDRIEHILEIIIFQEHSLKAGFDVFEKRENAVSLYLNKINDM